MVQLSMKMLTKSGSNQYAYNYADLLVQVKLGREFKLKADYSFMVYSENLRLMAGESTWKQNYWHNAWRVGRTFSMMMRSYNGALWMPGKYFFLMATNRNGCVIRFDLVLDDQCRFTVREPRRCKPLSDEDILAHQVFESAEIWNEMCDAAGIAQLRRKTLEWLKGIAANTNVADIQQNGVDAPNYNMLVTIDWDVNIDFHLFSAIYHVAYRCIAKMLIMSVPKLRIRIGDCKQFYKPDEENPYQLLDAFFDKENPLYDDTFDMEDHVNYWLWKSPYKDKEQYNDQPCTFVYVLYNVLCLDEEAMCRLHETLQEERQYAILCDYKDVVEDVMDLELLSKEYFPETNRVALENATPEEVIRRVFTSPKLYVKLTPAAVDKVCRLLVYRSKQRRLYSSDYYASRITESWGIGAWNSDEDIVLDADDIDYEELLS